MIKRYVAPVSDEDKALFRKEAGKLPASQTSEAATLPTLHDFAPKDPVGPEDVLSYQRHHIRDKRWKHLTLGKLIIEAKLDLHGLTLDEAKPALLQFLADAQNQKMQCVLLVHGKGYLSGDHYPTIKNAVHLWLPQHPAVKAYHSAPAKFGGSGAILILL